MFVAVHQRILSLTYVDDLLEQVKRCFTETHYDKADSGRTTYAGFNDDLARLTKKAEANAAAKRAEEEAEAAKKKALEEERARARAEIGGMAQTVDMAPEKVGSMMKEFEG